MSAGWLFLMPFPGCLPVLVLLPGIILLGRVSEWMRPPRQLADWPPPPHGRTGPYVPRAGPRPPMNL